MIEREADEDETNSHYGATAGGHIKFKRNQVVGRGIAHLYRLNRTARKHRLAVEQLQLQLAETTKANAQMSKKLKEVVHNVKHQQFQHRSLGGGVAPFPQYLPSAAAAVSSSQATTTSKPAPSSSVSAAPSSSTMMLMPPPATTAPTVASTAPATSMMNYLPQQYQQQQMMYPHQQQQQVRFLFCFVLFFYPARNTSAPTVFVPVFFFF